MCGVNGNARISSCSSGLLETKRGESFGVNSKVCVGVSFGCLMFDV